MSDDSRHEVTNSMGPYGCVPAWVLRDLRASEAPAPYRCLAVYVTMNAIWANNGACWPSRPKIAAEVGCSLDSVDRALKALVAIGAMEVHERLDEAGDQTSNLYVLHSIPWGGSRNSAATPHAGVSRKNTSSGGGRNSAATGGRNSAALTKPSRKKNPPTPRDDSGLPTSSGSAAPPAEEPLVSHDVGDTTTPRWDGRQYVTITNGVVSPVPARGPSLFAVVARVCGYDTTKMASRARGFVAAEAKALQGLGASEADVERVAAAIEAEWGQRAVTPASLVKHWPRFVGIPVASDDDERRRLNPHLAGAPQRAAPGHTWEDHYRLLLDNGFDEAEAKLRTDALDWSEP